MTKYLNIEIPDEFGLLPCDNCGSPFDNESNQCPRCDHKNGPKFLRWLRLQDSANLEAIYTNTLAVRNVA